MKLYLVFAIVAVGCISRPVFDEEQSKSEILKLHHAQREFHFNKDSLSFVNQLSDDFISVNRGLITSPSKEETLGRYNAYFSSVEFVKWDDLSDPIIKFSEDGTLAYTIVDKIVKVRYLNPEGAEEFGETHFAWIAIYRKTLDGWKIESVASTNEPG